MGIGMYDNILCRHKFAFKERQVMKANDFNVSSFQLSIFTPVLLFSKTRVLEKLLEKFSGVFDGDTVAIPIPEDAPKDIPQLILCSADGKIKLEVAENRVNFYRIRQDDDVQIEPYNISELSLKVLGYYKDITKANIGRMAIVIVRFMEKENSGLELAKHFSKDKWVAGPFKRPENFEIHAHKTYPLGSFSINSWVRCKTGKMSNKDNKTVVLVTQDINTLVTEMDSKNFSYKDLQKFSELAIKEQDNILNLYFPEE